MPSFTNRCRLRTVLVTAVIAVAALGVGASTAAASTWYLTVSPRVVAPKGTVVVHTTQRRACRLILTIGGRSFRFTMPRGSTRITMGSAVGVAAVKAVCGSKYATNTFTVRAPIRTAAPRTPITVQNVCDLNPGLGPVHDTTSDGDAVAYWADGGKLTLIAESIDGDSSVDVAAVVTSDGQNVAYFAYCNWSRWLSASYVEQQAEEQGVPQSQASSFPYLIQEQTDDSNTSEDEDWFQPSAGWQVCADNPDDDCDYEPTEGDDALGLTTLGPLSTRG